MAERQGTEQATRNSNSLTRTWEFGLLQNEIRFWAKAKLSVTRDQNIEWTNMPSKLSSGPTIILPLFCVLKRRGNVANKENDAMNRCLFGPKYRPEPEPEPEARV
ncbi:hypothetical protein HAX54_000356 [Datura stramonium]|uniref:Uncharacterized protein n=1 Tax=Datura stramonium TaxID=4076 RepID=A0ABS8T209_DATST|nr:hypothetical protein [Datura stramonium]